MRFRPKRTEEDRKRLVLYESMLDIQKIERDERYQRREAIHERALELYRGQNPRENDKEENPPELGHD